MAEFRDITPLNPKGLYQISRKKKKIVALCSRQRRLRNEQKRVMHLHSCCFANLNLKAFFCRSLYRRRSRCFQSSLLSFDGRRHSATGFSANVVVAETSYEMLDVLINITVLIFRVKKKKKNEVFRGSIFENTRKNLKAKSRTCGCSRPRI